MDEIAEAAGVGKGTLFRRFGSRAALARAVLSERERALQEEFIRGEPPLGPGAPPRERLVAFGEAVLDLLDAHAELLAAAEVGGARFASPPYARLPPARHAAAARGRPGLRRRAARRGRCWPCLGADCSSTCARCARCPARAAARTGWRASWSSGSLARPRSAARPGLGDDLDADEVGRRSARRASRRSSTASSAAIATASWSRSGSRVVSSCSFSPGPHHRPHPAAGCGCARRT